MAMKLKRMALRTSLTYGLFAAFWILLSDRVLVTFVSDPQAVGKLSTYKGWAFVAVTCFLLYATLHTQLQRWQQEVSARNRTEQALKESEERCRVAIEHSNDGVALFRGPGLIYGNQRLLDMFAYDSLEEAQRTDRFLKIHPDDREMVVRYATMRQRGEPAPSPYECRGIGQNGATMHLEVSVASVTYLGEPASLAYLRDVTERKKTQEALRESESRFRGAFEASGIGMALVALNGRWLKVNQSLCDMLGYSEQELLTKTFQDITHPDDLENDLEYIEKLMDDQIPYYRLEKRYHHRDGYIVWAALSVSLARDARGYPLYFVGQIEDITERKLLEEKLQTLSG